MDHRRVGPGRRAGREAVAPTRFAAVALVPLLALLLAAGPVLLGARPTREATTFTVTTVGDQPDADLTDDRCDANPSPASPCTLRAAIDVRHRLFHMPGQFRASL